MADDIRVKFDADASSYNKNIKDLAQQNKTLKSELDKVKSSTDENTTAQEKAAKIAEAVQKQVNGQEEYIKALKAEYDKLSQSEGDNTTALMKQEEKINKAETALNKMNEELADAQREADGYADEAQDATKQTEEMDEAARLLAASKLAEFYDKVSEAVQKVAAASYDAAKELDEGYDTIIKKTGATGDALGDLQTSADNVFGRLPAEMSDVGTAIGEVNTRFGLTGSELEDVSELFLQFAEITDSDVNNAIGTTSRLLKTYGGNIKDADKVLGYFAKQSQQTGIDTNTLLSSLDKNGATLREMGLDLQQSTKLLALFEENGVDSAGAMTGLRKAVINGAKAGKSFDQVISEASDSIKNAATDADALEIATELFGTKGAVVMADGIRSGRISLDDLSESMETYGDVVGDTFEATLDPWDKAKVAMNNLKIAGSELAGEALSAIAPLLDKVVDGIQKAVKWFKELPEPVKRVVSVVGMLAAGAGVAFPKVQSLMNTLSMFKAANAIKGLTGATQATEGLATGATKAGGAFALMSSPITIATAAVAGVGLALAGLAKHTENAIEAEYGLTEAQKEQIATIHDQHEAYTEMVSAREQAVSDAMAEFGYIENLAREYDTLIDANGKVKKGYEDRANFILNEMATATGKSIEDIQREARENGSLSASIQDVINKKKAEALLSVYQADYAEAIKNSAAAYDTYKAAVETAKQREEEYHQLQQDVSGYTAQREALVAQLSALDQNSYEYQTLSQQLADLDNTYLESNLALQKTKQAFDDASAAVDEAQDTYLGYQSAIQKYEGASAAIISGDEKKIQSAVKALSGDFTTAEKTQEKSLQNQVKSTQSNLDRMERLYAQKKVSKAVLEEARAASENAKKQLNDFYTIGVGASDGLVRGVNSKKGAVAVAGRETGMQLVTSTADGAQTHSPSRATQLTGQDVGQGLINGLNSKKGAVQTAGKTIGQTATDSIKPSTAGIYAAGQNLSGQLESGINSKRSLVQSTSKGVADAANNGVKPSNSGVYASGQSLPKELAKGMDNTRGQVGTSAGLVLGEQKKARIAANTAKEWGREYTNNIAAGMIDGKAINAVRAASSKVATAMASKTKHSVPKDGPLKDELLWGVHMAENIADSMTSALSMRKLNDAANAVAEAMTLPTLSFGAEGINGTSKSFAMGDINVSVSGANIQNDDLLAQKIGDEIFRQVRAQQQAFA